MDIKNNYPSTSAKACVYTTLFGSYEQLNEQPVAYESNIPFICISDNLCLRSETWQIRHIPAFFGRDVIRSQRLVKLLPHRYISDFDCSLYIDNSVILTRRVDALIFQHLASAPFSVFAHSFRESVLDEFLEVARLGLDDQGRIFEQLNHYYLEFPDVLSARPYWAGIMFRDHRHPLVQAMHEIWIYHVLRYSRRDQLSMNVAFHLSGLTPNVIEMDNHESDFHTWPHANRSNKNNDNRNPIISCGPLVAGLRHYEQCIASLEEDNDNLKKEIEKMKKSVLRMIFRHPRKALLQLFSTISGKIPL